METREELDRTVTALADREAIRDCLMRYCRGIDRCDAEVLRSVYWPEATDDHGSFEGTAEAFIAWVIPVLERMDATQHLLGNILIDLAGDMADVETYVVAYHYIPDDEGHRDMVAGGRYLDRFEKRGGEWRIARRTFVMDWNQSMPATAQWSRELFGALSFGGRKPNDPIYRPVDERDTRRGES